MKKVLFIALLCSLFVGCNEEQTQEKELNIVGCWHLTELHQIETRTVTIGEETIEIYIDFAADNTFRLYQMVGAGKYRSFSGSWVLEADKLSGIYDDKTAWGTDYEVALNSTGTELTLVSKGEQYVYVKEEIPADVLLGAK